MHYFSLFTLHLFYFQTLQSSVGATKEKETGDWFLGSIQHIVESGVLYKVCPGQTHEVSVSPISFFDLITLCCGPFVYPSQKYNM